MPDTSQRPAAPEAPFQFAVIIEKSIFHEGDERSRTNPGHGYPEHTELVEEFKEFKSEAEFRRWIEREESSSYGRVKYRAIAFKPVSITKNVSFDIKA